MARAKRASASVPSWIPNTFVIAAVLVVGVSVAVSLLRERGADEVVPVVEVAREEPVPVPVAEPEEPELPPLPAPATLEEAASQTEIRTMITQYTQAVVLEQERIADACEAAIVARGRDAIPFIEWSMALNARCAPACEALARMKSTIEARFPAYPEPDGPVAGPPPPGR